MTAREILEAISIPPLFECGENLDKWSRLKTYYHILEISKQTNNAKESLDLINNTLIYVENCHSGLDAETAPGLKYKGRMYPIEEDRIDRLQDGKIIAQTTGNKIIIESNGSFAIYTRIDDELLLLK